MSEGNNSGGGGCYYLFIIVTLLAGVIGMGTLVKACSDTNYSSSSYSNRSNSAAEEASHYHYDSNGHLYDDRY